jgi:hypothetical protein
MVCNGAANPDGQRARGNEQDACRYSEKSASADRAMRQSGLDARDAHALPAGTSASRRTSVTPFVRYREIAVVLLKHGSGDLVARTGFDTLSNARGGSNPRPFAGRGTMCRRGSLPPR